MKKRILLLAVALLMICSLSLTAYATHPVPDLSSNGSITLQMAPGGVALKDGNLNMVLAEELLTLAKEEKLVARTTKIKDGQAVFNDLAHGLYVVWQAQADASTGFMPINPFLLSVPRYIGGEYVMDVVAEPKVALETVPPTTTPPTTPPPPELPQSGQLNWPVPVLAVCGAAMLILGFVMVGRKREGNA